MSPRLILLCWMTLLVTALFAQQPNKPSAFDEWRASRINIYMNDFGELERYRSANAALLSAKGEPNRVVFFGDSITDFWKLDEYFPGKPYVNRGITAQTTPQMLIRFRPDVVDLKPAAVLILAGTNDIAGNTGPMTLEQIESNYASIAELARANKVRLIFGSILPIHNYTPESQDFFAERSTEKILSLNRWLKNYCGENDCIYLDYFSALVDDKGLLKKELADDGLHPNAAGYKVMAPLAEAAIQKAVRK
jgi:lysophospholipase L1-like esterase